MSSFRHNCIFTFGIFLLSFISFSSCLDASILQCYKIYITLFQWSSSQMRIVLCLPYERAWVTQTTICWPWLGKGCNSTTSCFSLEVYLSSFFVSYNLGQLIIKWGSSHKQQSLDCPCFFLGPRLFVSLVLELELLFFFLLHPFLFLPSGCWLHVMVFFVDTTLVVGVWVCICVWVVLLFYFNVTFPIVFFTWMTMELMAP